MGTQYNNPISAAQTPPWDERLASGDPTLRVHLLGIGGSGLSAIAKVLLDAGIQVSGSDRQESVALEVVAKAGAKVFSSQSSINLTGMDASERPDVVLISSAVDRKNPERRAAEDLGIPVVKRSEFLPALLAKRKVIAVAGTHGKTTTTSMILTTLRQAGIDCGYIVGATLPIYGNAAAGTAPWFVIEADEYDRMFHGLHPTTAVITNVEWDHPDCYPTAASFMQAFTEFVDGAKEKSVLITCADDEGAEQIGKHGAERGLRWLRYGLNDKAELHGYDVHPVSGKGTVASLCWHEQAVGQIELKVPGLHNLRNALAAFAVASKCGVSIDTTIAGLESYRGTSRRFEIKGENKGVTVIDDYAHHPTEVQATLSAAHGRFPERRIWAVFQPHTFSRTRTLLHEMANSFGDADQVIVSDIYAAREANDGTVNAADLVAASNHPAIQHIAKLGDISTHLAAHVAPGDVVITLGAGDGNKVGEWLLEKLRDA